MKNLLLALQFLTIIPVKIKGIGKGSLAKSLIYFPLIGLLLGIALAVVNNLLQNLSFPEFSINIILVVLLMILTGGIHLDGLADSADAFLSRKNEDEMLAIMRDSHIGVMGVLALISVVLLKIAFLSSIGISSKIAALILICVLSRWSMVFAIFLFPYARKEGKAKVFFEGINLKIFVVAAIITSVLAFAAWKVKGLKVFTAVSIKSYTIQRFVNNKINGITGDTLGALCELNEAAALLLIIILR